MHQTRLTLGLLAGRLASDLGTSRAAAYLGVKRTTLKYWKDKWEDPDYHPDTWGGARDFFASPEGQLDAECVVWLTLEADPSMSFRQLLEAVWANGLDVSSWWLSKTISSWGWNWARARLIARHKFTDANIEWYIEYLVSMVDVPLHKVPLAHLVRSILTPSLARCCLWTSPSFLSHKMAAKKLLHPQDVRECW